MNQTTVKHPFSQTAVSQAVHSDGMIEARSRREASEVQAMVFMAKQFPRDQILATDRILNACTRESLAEGAVYSYPRGGQVVEGPSIRLAEVLAQNWGNIDFGIRELSQANGESVVEAYAWDLETNVRQTKVFQVPHKRFSGGTSKVLTDYRDIYEVVASQGSRRLRACILGIIPGDIVEAAVKQCSETLKMIAEPSPEKIKKMLDILAALGITPEMIQDRYQCRVENIRAAQLAELRKIYTSLKDGMSKVSDWFAVNPPKATDLNRIAEAPVATETTQTEPDGNVQPTVESTKQTQTKEGLLL